MCSKENSRESWARRAGLKLCLGFVVIASAEKAKLSVLMRLVGLGSGDP